MTIGVSAYKNGASIQNLMDDADKKLYYGKHHGKNQVVNRLSEDDEDTKPEKKQKKVPETKSGLVVFSELLHIG